MAGGFYAAAQKLMVRHCPPSKAGAFQMVFEGWQCREWSSAMFEGDTAFQMVFEGWQCRE